MTTKYIADKTFQGEDFSGSRPEAIEYDNCIFEQCNFANADLSSFRFQDCSFNNCDLSMVKVVNTSFQDARFENSKLMGVHFEDCNKFLLSIHFNGCMLNLSSFYQLDLKKSRFSNCMLLETEFTGADLSGLELDYCDLAGSVFGNSNLEKCDFRSAKNYSIDPENNRIKKARFSLPGLSGLLDKYDIVID